jgi:ubiquinone/menaquinone biosynthesis C-methylase UbiE
MDLIKLTNGTIFALDNHQPFLDALNKKVMEHGVAHRIHIINCDMLALGFKERSFDVIWAEGAIYIVGFEKGITTWKPLLKNGGYLAVTEATWLKLDAPDELKGFWAEAYPAMQDIDGNLEIIKNTGCRIVDYFTLPESAWWDDYYNPLEKKLALFREKYKGNDEAIRLAEIEQTEIDLYRSYPDYYGYVFYIMQWI